VAAVVRFGGKANCTTGTIPAWSCSSLGTYKVENTKIKNILRKITADLPLQIDDYDPKNSLVISPTKMGRFYKETKLEDETYPWQSKFYTRANSPNINTVTDLNRSNLPPQPLLNCQDLPRPQMRAPPRARPPQRTAAHPQPDACGLREVDDIHDPSPPKPRIQPPGLRGARDAHKQRRRPQRASAKGVVTEAVTQIQRYASTATLRRRSFR